MTTPSARPMRAKLWTAANVLMTLVFVFAVAVQLNDPDPLRWSLVYGLAAAACALEARRMGAWPFPALLAAAGLVWGLTIAPDVIGRVPLGALFDEFEMRDIGVERAREMYGLFVISGWMLLLAGAAFRRRGRPAASAPAAERPRAPVGARAQVPAGSDEA